MTVPINVNVMTIINPCGAVANMAIGMNQADKSHVD